MSVAFAEPVLDRPAPRVRPARPAPGRTGSKPRRAGAGVAPVARPRRLRFVAPSGPAHTCAAEPVVQPRRSWRLTDRGLAVVLVLAAALVAASVAVVGLTALRVTGESYHPVHAAAAPVLVER